MLAQLDDQLHVSRRSKVGLIMERTLLKTAIFTFFISAQVSKRAAKLKFFNIMPRI